MLVFNCKFCQLDQEANIPESRFKPGLQYEDKILTSSNASQSLTIMFGRKRSAVTSFSNLLLRSFTEASESSITGP